MNTTSILSPIYNQLRHPTLRRFRSGARHFYPFRTTTSASQIPDKDRPMQPSKRDPTMETTYNTADELERLLQKDGFKTWGFVIYRCTYQSGSDWEKFMNFFLYRITEKFEFYNGLDLLDSFAPIVFEDQSFDGANTTLLRKHFQEWAATAPQEEQGVDHARFAQSGRYRFFVMVGQEALESVLGAPDPDDCNKTGFVRLVNGVWKPEELDEDELAERGRSAQSQEYEPLEGCALEDVGWMKVLYDDAEAWGFLHIRDSIDWSTYYQRPPVIQSNL
ncbi:hypothetical protein EYZ11_008794 [Aspergillus tanneri]|uniref:Muramidase n=1 Tax=Aspergillus tanneri TaxID=1220188 RepID=A0A4S3J9J5_9EURO|nr:uncharacterized protein ATNIH1004_005742 [Aspergillus tanneri]KAA8647059.1 hypothetical protein ATNIH1004_005742 [Aspergillus tanneri]THC91743.1 hypothetical protein EYZ11_008794 [Aspergillus tanneri]